MPSLQGWFFHHLVKRKRGVQWTPRFALDGLFCSAHGAAAGALRGARGGFGGLGTQGAHGGAGLPHLGLADHVEFLGQQFLVVGALL